MWSWHCTMKHVFYQLTPKHNMHQQVCPLARSPLLFIYALFMKTRLVIRLCLEMWSACKWSSVYWRPVAVSITRLGPSVLPVLLLSFSLPSCASESRGGRTRERFQQITYVWSFYPAFPPALFICSKQTEPCCHSPWEAKAHHFLRQLCFSGNGVEK